MCVAGLGCDEQKPNRRNIQIKANDPFNYELFGKIEVLLFITNLFLLDACEHCEFQIHVIRGQTPGNDN